jgi:hypothetical protein
MPNYENINDLMNAQSSQDELLSHTRKLVEKWEPTGLLDGIDDESKKSGMSVLLENQASQLVKEASATSGANKEEWSGVALPLVRRIFGELAAQDLVSVQPMNLPSGLIFYLDFKYGNGRGRQTKGSDIFGNTSGSGDATGGLYGAGKFGYSVASSSANFTCLATGTTPTTGTYVTASAVWEDADFEPALSGSTLFKVSVLSSDLSSADLKAARAFNISGAGITTVYPAYTKVGATQTSFIVAATSLAAGDVTASIEFTKETSATSRGDFEDTPTEPTPTDLSIPQVDIQMRSIPIVAKTRKLKAVWTPELAQDLNAYHSVDAEAELTSMLSEYVSMEIDLEILDMLMHDASAKTENWSAKVGYEYNSSIKGFSETSANSNAYTKGDWFQTLGNKIQAVSNAIHQKTLRGGANFIVVSPETATIIESIPGYAAGADGDAMSNKYAMGVQKVGALNNRYTVYKNPYMLENQILVGFRGSNFLETGAVYAPYIPLIMTPLVYDPVNFTPRKGVMTRYAKKMVRSEFYGKVIVADANLV